MNPFKRWKQCVNAAVTRQNAEKLTIFTDVISHVP